MQTIAFSGQKREVNQKASTIRNEGKIPAVIYGDGVLEHFSVKHNDIKKMIFTPDFKSGELDLEGTKYNCIVKDIQWHPITDKIHHIDFLALKDGVKVKVDIPIKFKGESPGVKEGGKLMQSMRRVKVKLDPKDLVDELFVDISNLVLGEAVRVRDIELSDNIELMVNSAVPVASVEVPRALKSATAAEDGEGEVAAEGEATEAPAAD